ncbi:carboxypeptidase S [Whalleya microplaca]|nr:carboxypeptidase S [Whalleya microplaca]
MATTTTRSSLPWALFAKLTALLIILKFTFDILSVPSLIYNTASKDVSRCPQVEPLVPTHQTPALSKMDDYIASPKFRNETIGRMAGAIQVPSQSYDDLGPIGEDSRWDVMYDMAAYLEKIFPLIHSTLKLEKVNTHGLLYTWKGTPPFSGYYDGYYVWGRGSEDCKNNLIGIMEAVELLIDAGFEPKRTLVLSFGFDEEVGKGEGANYLANVLIDRYGKDGAAIIVDEGAGASTAWGSTFSLPGVAEKGYIDVEIIVRMPGGHSSVPPAHNGIGVISELITMIEANPYEPRLYSENPFLALLQCGAEHSPDFPSKLKKLLPSHKGHTCAKKDKLAQEAAKSGDYIKYLFTTSVASDVISGGVKNNALPERTRVLVNHRINVGSHPSDVQAKITRLAETVAGKHNLTLHAFNNEMETPRSITLNAGSATLEPAPVTPTSVETVTPYFVLSGTTRALYGEAHLVAPGIMTGNTDTRYYWDLTKHIFRYNPGWDPKQEGFDGIHTIDEKLSILAHIKGVEWYSTFVRNMDEAEV